jgi:hypothetical protein
VLIVYLQEDEDASETKRLVEAEGHVDPHRFFHKGGVQRARRPGDSSKWSGSWTDLDTTHTRNVF